MGVTFLVIASIDQEPSRRLLLLDDGGGAGATNGALVADFGLLDAVFSFHAARESHRADLGHDFPVGGSSSGNRAVTAWPLYDVVFLGHCRGGASDDQCASNKKGCFHGRLSVA